MASAIPVIPADWLKSVGSGEVTATVGKVDGLVRADGSPSQAGDVLSVQPDGSLQTRPAGTAGNYERAVVTSAGLVYRPVGQWAYLVPLAQEWPN